MSDFVSSLTTFRDLLLLIVNIGMLVMLFVIAAQLSGQRRRSKTVPTEVRELLVKILESQRKAASALATSGNEFRNHLKSMVINVESTDLTQPASDEGPAPGNFKSLRRQVERLEKHLDDTLLGFQALTHQSSESIDKLVSGLHSDRRQERDLAQEFQARLRADLAAQADRIGQVVSELPTTPVIAGNGHDPARPGLRQTVETHQESLHKLLTDFMGENIRQARSAEEFRSELRKDFRNQTELLSRAVSDITRKVAAPPAAVSDTTTPAPLQLDLEGPFKQWLERTQQLHESLVGEVRNATSRIEFPTNEFRQITDQHHESLRKLLEDWTEESIRRVRATDELRAAIQQDVKTQADRLRHLVEAHPAPAPTTGTQTTGTITASAGTGEADREWRNNVQHELQNIIGRLDRMHARMEEIFQI